MSVIQSLRHTYRNKRGVCLSCGEQYHDTWLTPKEFKHGKARVFIHNDTSGVTKDWCVVHNEGEGDSLL